MPLGLVASWYTIISFARRRLYSFRCTNTHARANVMFGVREKTTAVPELLGLIYNLSAALEIAKVSFLVSPQKAMGS